MVKGTRKAYLILSAMIMILAAGFILSFTPRPVIAAPSDARIDLVAFRGVSIAGFDEKGLIAALSEYECRRTIKSVFPYDTSRFDIEIDGLVSEKPIHIMISQSKSIVYESADQSVFEIIDKEGSFRNRIVQLLTVSE